MKSSSKKKRTAGGDGLTTKEKRILAMARGIEREAKRLRRGLSPWFYQHGWVSVAEAAKGLRCNAEEIEALIKDHGLRCWLAGDGGPEPKGSRMIPLSELRRVAEKRARSSLETLASRMWEVLKPSAPEHFKLSPKWINFGFWPIFPPKLDVAKIAARLNITPRTARQFINADGPVSLACFYEGRSLVTTPEELEAFQKTYRREIARARRARGTFAEPRLGMGSAA